MVAAAGNPSCYFAASGVSALAFFPLWKAAAIGQSGYQVAGQGYWQKYFEAMKPPWRGSIVVIGGMTWARAAIFYGSDTGSKWMRQQGFSTGLAATVPSLCVSAFAQAVNQPFVRSSIMLQNPGEELAKKTFPNVAMLRHLATTKGISSWFTGLDAAILKTAPKYMVAVIIKDYMGQWLAPVDPKDKTATLLKSAKVSVTAGVAGAVLTNPLDVVRNEMFKTEGCRTTNAAGADPMLRESGAEAQMTQSGMRDEGTKEAFKDGCFNEPMVQASVPLLLGASAADESLAKRQRRGCELARDRLLVA